jgi:hypothetical protein
MKRAIHKFFAILVPALVALAPAAHARVDSEVSTMEKRHLSVEKAILLAKQKRPTPLPVPLILPFAPPSFDLTDAEEAAAAAAAARMANPSAPASTAQSDHDLLADIVSKVRPGGTAYLGNRPMLIFGKNIVRIGAHFTVTYKGNDYDLELTQIDGTNFTLRYKSDEITRPIQAAQPAKSP